MKFLHLIGAVVRRYLPVFILVLAFVSRTELASAANVTDALERPSISLSPSVHPFLLSASQAGDRLITVGERGVVLLSDDGGSSWRQSLTPVSVTLTSVSFADHLHGFVVGHGGVVLATSNGGETWERRLDGREIAKMTLAAAEGSHDERLIQQAQRFMAEGPDKPLLDILVLDQSRLIVVGAFGLALFSEDGGHSWISWKERLHNPSELHLYAIRARGSEIVVVGEQGLVRISKDSGKTFSAVNTSYGGSFFTLELVGPRDMVLAGLRGNAWKSQDLGLTWSQMATPTPASIVASAIRADGALILASQAGVVLLDKGEGLHTLKELPGLQLNSVLEKRDGGLLLLGQHGALVTNPGDIK